jgi:hypothetical protein
MDRFISAINRSLETDNWNAALFQALTLPDICARLEAENGKTSGPKYVEWFDKYLASSYRDEIGCHGEIHVFLSGSDCYALRCAMLHEGSDDIGSQRARQTLDRFQFTANRTAHLNQDGPVLQLDVSAFCMSMTWAAQRWLNDFRRDHPEKVGRLDELITIVVDNAPVL